MDWQQLITTLEDALREGRGQEARRLLKSQSFARVPDFARLPLARCARRSSIPQLALRLLHPKVRPSERRLPSASPAEQAEYAANLVQVGVVREGLEILESLPPSQTPEAGLFRAFAWFTQWNYRAAIPSLIEYEKLLPTGSYDAVVARVNLAAAYVFERESSKAKSLLESLRRDCVEANHKRLLGNVLELLSQQAIFDEDWNEAKQSLTAASRHLKEMGTIDSFFVEKWNTILEGLKTGNRRPLLRVQRLATTRGHWETVRDLDYFLLKIRFEPARFHKLAGGTPYPNYLRRLLLDFSSPLPSEFKHRLGPRGKANGVMDLVRGTSPEGRRLKEGNLNWKLGLALAADLYRPPNAGRLAERIYPDERFHPRSTPVRIRQAIKELRKWLAQAGPAFIQEERGHYRWDSKIPLDLVLPRGERPLNRSESRASRLHQAFGSEWFTRKKAESTLSLSSRAVQNLLQSLAQSDTLEVRGRGPATQYRLNRA